MLNDLLAKNQSSDKLFVEDVFSTYLYTGNGGSSQTVTNGINLSGKGGLVWIKGRNSSSAATGHVLTDTERGRGSYLQTQNTTQAVTSPAGYDFVSFNSDGYSVGSANNFSLVNSSVDYVSWTFRKAPKFFDVVTYTGNGATNRQISHSLGATPGMLIVKCTSTSASWVVWHRSLGGTNYNMYLNGTFANAANGDLSPNGLGTITSTSFCVSADYGLTNTNGATYVAYLFAHDTTADGVIQCGSFTNDGSGNATVNLGWEPQFILTKRTDGSTGGLASWVINDTMRGVGADAYIGGTLNANDSSAEIAGNSYPRLTATGFNFTATANQSFIYLAIRRGPMRVPTDATKVFSPNVRVGTGTAVTYSSPNFAPDALFSRPRSGGQNWAAFDKLRGGYPLITNATSAEDTTVTNAVTGYTNTGFNFGIDNTGSISGYVNGNSFNYVYEIFCRAPGFFDATCYSGTGATLSVKHNLGVVPELIILKRRDSAANWPVWRTATGTGTTFGYLNDSGAEADQGVSILTASPTSSAFSVGAWGPINASGGTYVAYLFASCPGVSKVGTYTGTGTTLQINCGFTNGARFVLIKRTDSTGGWHVWDSARGIAASNDPYLLLNSTAAEVTNTDYIDPLSTGFELSSTAPAALNANGGTYIYLAIA